MLHLLEVQCRGRDLEDGLVVDLDGVGAWGQGWCVGQSGEPADYRMRRWRSHTHTHSRKGLEGLLFFIMVS